jgi:hypothetical protein
MDPETPSVEANYPMWCVGHHISNPDIHFRGDLVDEEQNIGVR